MKERRKFPRYKVRLEVEYDVENAVEIESKTHTSNIGEGGLSMPLNKAVRPGRRIKMKIKIPYEDKEVEALGKVVWKKPMNKELVQEEDAGIKFLGIYEDGRDVLTDYLQNASSHA